MIELTWGMVLQCRGEFLPGKKPRDVLIDAAQNAFTCSDHESPFIHPCHFDGCCFFCFEPTSAADTKFAPYVVEMFRCQDVIQMTLDLLPLCAQDDWDVASITKAAQAHAKHEYEMRKAYEDVDSKKSDFKPVEDATTRRDKFLQENLTQKQIRQLLELRGITDLINSKNNDVSDAYAAAYAAKLRTIISKSPVHTAKEISGWKVTLQDVDEILQAMKTSPKLASPDIQSAIALSLEALKNCPEKAAALINQLTETLQKAEVVM